MESMESIIERMPAIDYRELNNELLAIISENEGYLFYKTVRDDDGECYLVYCTSCTEHRYINKSRKLKITELEHCPICHTPVTVKKYIDDRSYKNSTHTVNIKFMYTMFLKGDNTELYAVTLKCEADYSGEPSEEHINFNHYRITYYDKGIARQFECTYQSREKTMWTEKREVTEPFYYKTSQYYGATEQYPHLFSNFERQGTCIEHSCIEDEKILGLPLFSYLAYFVKNQNIEKLIKAGYGNWIVQRFNVRNSNRSRALNSIVNLKENDFYSMFKCSKSEAKMLKDISLDTVYKYQKLKKLKIIASDINVLIRFASICSDDDIKLLQKHKKANFSKIIKYLCKQSNRTGSDIRHTVMDYIDYLKQIDELALVNADYFPHDLNLQHSRLSERLRELQKRQIVGQNVKNAPFFRHVKKICKPFVYRNDKYIVRPIDSKYELIIESEQNNNCVAGYANKHMKGKRCIFVIRDKKALKKSLCTVELDITTGVIIQCRAYRNGKYSKQVEQFVEKWKLHIAKQLQKVG